MPQLTLRPPASARRLSTASTSPAWAPAAGPAHRAILVLAASLAAAGLAACTSRAAPTTVDTVLGTHLSPVSVQQISNDVDAVYRNHPGIGSFEVQDVQFTPQTRNRVLTTCTSGGTAPTSETTESGRLVACAPLIFFFYSYGQKASAPDAINLADKLYSFAVTNIVGPLDAGKTLGSVLKGWGVPVAKDQAGSGTSALEGALLIAAKKAILAQTGVHIVVTHYHVGSKAAAGRIVADAGATSASEELMSGSAVASIRVTPAAAYFSGNTGGLKTLIGVSSSAASKIGSRWVEMKAGTSEYKNLAAESLISALPASILPAAGNSGTLASQTMAGRQVYVLTWQVSGGSTGTISEQLVLTATSAPVPLRETSNSEGATQTVEFTHWGQHVTVAAPSPTVAFSNATR